MLENNKRERRVKLICPIVSKTETVNITVAEEERVDLGGVASVFGLDPSTVKLNSHYISRGPDLVSPSVTWRSLLNFFYSKGFPTGDSDRNPLVVLGKLCKVGTKRAHEPGAPVSEINCKAEPDMPSSIERLLDDTTIFHVTKRQKENESGSRQVLQWNSGAGFKRKQLLEDVNLLKKLRIDEANSDSGSRGSSHPNIGSSSPFKCSYSGGNFKRIRGDEAIRAAPSKRIK